MNVLILPGFSESNLSWAQECQKSLLPQFPSQIHHLNHWSQTDHEIKNFDPQSEYQNSLWKDQQFDFVLAKSIGTYFTAWLLSQKLIHPQKIILCGIPLGLAKMNYHGEYLIFKEYLDKLSIFHNDHDIVGSALALNEFLKDLKIDISPIIKPRSDHDYPYYDEFKNIFLK